MSNSQSQTSSLQAARHAITPTLLLNNILHTHVCKTGHRSPYCPQQSSTTPPFPRHSIEVRLGSSSSEKPAFKPTEQRKERTTTTRRPASSSPLFLFPSLTPLARPSVRPPAGVPPCLVLLHAAPVHSTPARNAPAAAAALVSVQQLSAKCRGTTIRRQSVRPCRHERLTTYSRIIAARPHGSSQVGLTCEKLFQWVNDHLRRGPTHQPRTHPRSFFPLPQLSGRAACCSLSPFVPTADRLRRRRRTEPTTTAAAAATAATAAAAHGRRTDRPTPLRRDT